jgi:glycerophosphoryl diester phosphodiesterase
VPSGFLDYPRPLAFAHRGGASHFPENSWKAFEHAVGLGYAYLETDVHATADGTVIAFHDKTLDRVTDGTGTIAQLTAAQVATARIGGREPIPLLAELLASWPEHRFNIDVKSPSSARWSRYCGPRTHGTGSASPRSPAGG